MGLLTNGIALLAALLAAALWPSSTTRNADHVLLHDLSRWIESEGGMVHSALGLGPNQRGVRGLFTAAALPSGALLCRIPLRQLFSVDLALHSLGQDAELFDDEFADLDVLAMAALGPGSR